MFSSYKWWKLIAICVTVFLCLWVVCGCAPLEGTSIANPGASMVLRPLKGEAELRTNRDDKCTLKEMSVVIPASAGGPLAGTTVVLKDLDLDASASKVRKANSGQIDAFADYKLAEGEAAANVIDSVGDAGSQILSGVARLKRSERANTGYQVILALFAFVLALFLLLIFGGLLLYLVKKAWSILFPVKAVADPMTNLLTTLFSTRMNPPAST